MNGAEAACQQKRQGGYTIVEVMIVLTVTMVLFAAAVISVSGRQNRVEFSQSVNDLKGALEQSINQVGSGYYADIGDLGTRTCLGGANITFSATTTQKGGSGACTFIGQAIEFGIGPATHQSYTTYTVAALRAVSSTSQPVASMSQANPRLVFPDGTASTSTFPDGSDTEFLKNGLSVLNVKYNGNSIGGFALLSDVGKYDGGLLSSGTQSLKLYPLLPSTMGTPTYTATAPLQTNQQDFARKVNSKLPSLDPDVDANPSSGIQICLLSGGTDQSAVLTIGGANRALGVSISIKDNKTCS